jgi:Na+/H+ antiporter NhaB
MKLLLLPFHRKGAASGQDHMKMVARSAFGVKQILRLALHKAAKGQIDILCLFLMINQAPISAGFKELRFFAHSALHSFEARCAPYSLFVSTFRSVV